MNLGAGVAEHGQEAVVDLEDGQLFVVEAAKNTAGNIFSQLL